MGSGKRLNDCEKGLIDNLKQKGYSNRRIATIIMRSERVVRNYLKLGETYGIKLPTIGNAKGINRQKMLMRYEPTRKLLKCRREIKEKLDLLKHSTKNNTLMQEELEKEDSLSEVSVEFPIQCLLKYRVNDIKNSLTLSLTLSSNMVNMYCA